MLRVLLLFLLLVAMLRLLPRLLRALHARAPESGDRHIAQMVRCAHCAVFLPAADAVSEGGAYYCSDDHRRRGPARQE